MMNHDTASVTNDIMELSDNDIVQPQAPQRNCQSRGLDRARTEAAAALNGLVGNDAAGEVDSKKDTTTIPTTTTPRTSDNNNNNTGRYLDSRPMLTMRPSADTLFSDLSLYTGDVSNGQRHGFDSLRSPSPVQPEPASELPSPKRRRSLRRMISKAWIHSKGMLMVILSQFFGASMNVMTQVLERDGSHGKAMHPFQILFTRMFITATASFAYMWYTRVPNPFGTREVRWLLILRAAGGFFGVFGMYFSLLYMPLAEATVLTFLAPIVSCYVCSFLMPNESFTRKQQLAGLISLFGVVLIARPFSGGKIVAVEDVVDLVPSNSTVIDGSPRLSEGMTEPPSAYHHLMAIGFSLLGVLGSSCAYTTIRVIGSRTHALVSVTYFSTYTTLVSVIAMIAIPSVTFRLPGNLPEWGLLLGLGVNGFVMQYLLTAGLSYEPPPSFGGQGHGTRATSMVYTQMLFALFYDKVIMHSSPSAISWAGSGLILGSALYVAIVRDSNTIQVEDRHVLDIINSETADPRRKDIEEGRALLAREPDVDEPGDERDDPEASSR